MKRGYYRVRIIQGFWCRFTERALGSGFLVYGERGVCFGWVVRGPVNIRGIFRREERFNSWRDLVQWGSMFRD